MRGVDLSSAIPGSSTKKGIISGIDQAAFIEISTKKEEQKLKDVELQISKNTEIVAALEKMQSLLTNIFQKSSVFKTNMVGGQIVGQKSPFLSVKPILLMSDGSDAARFIKITSSAGVPHSSSYELTIQNLASTKSVYIKPYSTSGSVISFSSGTSIVVSSMQESGKLTQGTFYIESQGNQFPITLTTNDTLGMICSKINFLKDKSQIVAEILKISTNDFRLILKSTVSGGDFNLSNIGYQNIRDSGPSRITFQDILVERTGNFVEDLVPNLQMELLSPTPPNVFITLEFTPDVDTINNSLVEFMDIYNEFIQFACIQTEKDKETFLFKPTAYLAKESVFDAYFQFMKSAMKSRLTQISNLGITLENLPEDLENKIPMLYDIIRLDHVKLDTAIQKDTENTRRIFETTFESNKPQLIYESNNGKILRYTKFKIAISPDGLSSSEIATNEDFLSFSFESKRLKDDYRLKYKMQRGATFPFQNCTFYVNPSGLSPEGNLSSGNKVAIVFPDGKTEYPDVKVENDLLLITGKSNQRIAGLNFTYDKSKLPENTENDEILSTPYLSSNSFLASEQVAVIYDDGFKIEFMSDNSRFEYIPKKTDPISKIIRVDDDTFTFTVLNPLEPARSISASFFREGVSGAFTATIDPNVENGKIKFSLPDLQNLSFYYTIPQAPFSGNDSSRVIIKPVASIVEYANFTPQIGKGLASIIGRTGSFIDGLKLYYDPEIFSEVDIISNKPHLSLVSNTGIQKPGKYYLSVNSWTSVFKSSQISTSGEEIYQYHQISQNQDNITITMSSPLEGLVLNYDCSFANSSIYTETSRIKISNASAISSINVDKFYVYTPKSDGFLDQTLGFDETKKYAIEYFKDGKRYLYYTNAVTRKVIESSTNVSVSSLTLRSDIKTGSKYVCSINPGLDSTYQIFFDGDVRESGNLTLSGTSGMFFSEDVNTFISPDFAFTYTTLQTEKRAVSRTVQDQIILSDDITNVDNITGNRFVILYNQGNIAPESGISFTAGKNVAIVYRKKGTAGNTIIYPEIIQNNEGFSFSFEGLTFLYKTAASIQLPTSSSGNKYCQFALDSSETIVFEISEQFTSSGTKSLFIDSITPQTNLQALKVIKYNITENTWTAPTNITINYNSITPILVTRGGTNAGTSIISFGEWHTHKFWTGSSTLASITWNYESDSSATFSYDMTSYLGEKTLSLINTAAASRITLPSNTISTQIIFADRFTIYVHPDGLKDISDSAITNFDNTKKIAIIYLDSITLEKKIMYSEEPEELIYPGGDQTQNPTQIKFKFLVNDFTYDLSSFNFGTREFNGAVNTISGNDYLQLSLIQTSPSIISINKASPDISNISFDYTGFAESERILCNKKDSSTLNAYYENKEDDLIEINVDAKDDIIDVEIQQGLIDQIYSYTANYILGNIISDRISQVQQENTRKQNVDLVRAKEAKETANSKANLSLARIEGAVLKANNTINYFEALSQQNKK